MTKSLPYVRTSFIGQLVFLTMSPQISLQVKFSGNCALLWVLHLPQNTEAPSLPRQKNPPQLCYGIMVEANVPTEASLRKQQDTFC